MQSTTLSIHSRMVLTGGKVTRPFGGECAVVGLSPTAASVPGIDCEAIAAAAFVRKPLLGTRVNHFVFRSNPGV